MEISVRLNSDEITPEELFEAQTNSERLGGGFEVEYGINEMVVKWNMTPKDPVAFIEMVDSLQREHSCDVLDQCECVDVDTLAYHQSINMYSIGDITPIHNVGNCE